MKYSRNKINVSGKALLAGPETGFPYIDANIVVEDWRKLHMIPLQDLVAEVTRVLEDAGVTAAFSSHRLKRMTSIIAKLRHNPGMGLGGLQDILPRKKVCPLPNPLLIFQKRIIVFSMHS